MISDKQNALIDEKHKALWAQAMADYRRMKKDNPEATKEELLDAAWSHIVMDHKALKGITGPELRKLVQGKISDKGMETLKSLPKRPRRNSLQALRAQQKEIEKRIRELSKPFEGKFLKVLVNGNECAMKWINPSRILLKADINMLQDLVECAGRLDFILSEGDNHVAQQ